MKILITTGIFEPEVGGPATYVPKLAAGLMARGHEVKVITYSYKPKYDFDTEYTFPLERVVRTKNKFLNYFHFFQAVHREAKKYDIIYSLDWFTAGIPMALAAHLNKKRYLLRIGGGYIWEKYLNDGHTPVTLRDFYRYGYYKKYPVMHKLMSYVLRGAQGIIFNTDVQRGFYAEYYGLSPRRLVTVFNPVPEHVLCDDDCIENGGLSENKEETSKIYSQNSSLRRTYAVDAKSREFQYKDYCTRGLRTLFSVSPDDATVQDVGSPSTNEKEIIFAGRMTVKNNIETLIRAFKNEALRNHTLTFIGDGFLVEKMKKLSEELGLARLGRVRFLPAMRQKELYEKIKSCRYVILPSWTDISPNIAYECMALGIPFLITQENFLSIRDQIPFMIDPRDVSDITRKMCLLAEDNSYKEYCNSLRNIKFENSWDDVCGAHVNIFQKCLGQ